jgi:hypothetical protein
MHHNFYSKKPMHVFVKPQVSEVSQHGFASIMIHERTSEKSLVSNNRYHKGDIITDFSAATTTSIPTYLTIQTGENIHITLHPSFLQYVNHSCAPNVFFDTTQMQLIALENIFNGDEFVFFYPSTEWKMNQPFECHCSSTHCLHHINGAFSLSDETIHAYRFTDFIQEKLLLQRQK